MDLFDRAGTRRQGGAGATDADTTLEGTVERLVYSGGDGAFTVARLKLERGGDVVTVVGSLVGVPAGAVLRVSGRFETTARFGDQFRVDRYTEVAPQTIEGLRRYLGSGLIKGIEPEFASRIVERFGIETLEILDRDPGRISEVPGIGPSRARAIRTAWSAQREVRKVMVFLQGYGVSPAFAARIYKKYGAAAIARVRENPYRLAFDVWGIGFLSADKLAAALGVARDAPSRAEAGVRHVLDEEGGNGHVYVPRPRLAQKAAACSTCPRRARTPPSTGSRSWATSRWTRRSSRTRVRPPSTRRASIVPRRRSRPGCASCSPRRRPSWRSTRNARSAGTRRRPASRWRASRPRRSRPRSPPRSRSSPVARASARRRSCAASSRSSASKGVAVALAAPTGRAAKRLSDATGVPGVDAAPPAGMAPAEGGFSRNAARPLEADVVIVDEASMVDVRLGADLIGALPAATRLVLVGDVDQLPSVGPGTVLADVIASGAVPVVRLTEIFRQAAQSLIVVNAHRIHDGDLPELGAGGGSRLLLPGGGRSGARGGVDPRSRADAPAAQVRPCAVTRSRCCRPCTAASWARGNLNLLLQEALTTGAVGVERGDAQPASRRQGDAGSQRLRQGSVERRQRRHRAHRHRGGDDDDPL